MPKDTADSVCYTVTIVEIFTSTYVIHALIGGVLFCLCAGTLGYFVVLRKMTFAAHALADIGIPGATGAILLGLDPLPGLIVFCLGGGLFIANTSKKGSEREIVTGTTLAFALGLGLFLAGLSSKATKNLQSLLFGSITTIDEPTLYVFGGFTFLVVVVMFFLYKKLLFASINPDVAQTKGINVKLLNLIFVLLLAITTVMSVQVLGALLPFALLITPTATIINFTANPKIIIFGSIALGIVAVIVSLFVSILLDIPTSFAICTFVFIVWGLSKLIKN
ncbi:zinc ABC transporter permease [Actinomycetota bacterium]|nr:zinc ABC transporter permease [Actinomycetota bacterium]